MIGLKDAFRRFPHLPAVSPAVPGRRLLVFRLTTGVPIIESSMAEINKKGFLFES
jgi:hypothetical protein